MTCVLPLYVIFTYTLYSKNLSSYKQTSDLETQTEEIHRNNQSLKI